MEMIEVSGAHVRTAFTVFKAAYGSGWRNAREPFKQLVYVEHFNKHRYILTELEATRVRNMLSDNGHAYCKALIVKLLKPKPPLRYPNLEIIEADKAEPEASFNNIDDMLNWLNK